jgi:Tfp pilus assembly protein PilF
LKAGSGAVQAKLMASGSPEAPEAATEAKAAPDGPATLEKLMNQATDALKNRNFSAAIEGFNDVLRADPKNTLALIGLGDAYQRSGQFAEAEVALKKCLTYAPDSAPAYQTLGMTYFRGNRLNEAMSAFEESLKRDSKQALAHHYLGIIASRLKQGERAEKEFRTALAINPEFGEAHFNLAVLYVSWEPPQWDKARAEYQSAMGKGVLPDEALEKLLKP